MEGYCLSCAKELGLAPVDQMFEKFGIGEDEIENINEQMNDMLESMASALTIQRHNAGKANVAWGEVTTMLFKNNAEICKRYFDSTLGVLKKGASADVVVMDYKPFTPFDNTNIDGHMIFGMTGRQCETTIGNGKLLMKDRELVGIDEEAVNARILEEAKRLWTSL